MIDQKKEFETHENIIETIKVKRLKSSKKELNSRKGWKNSWRERNVALTYFETICNHKHQMQPA
jgi:hypothetical protein